MDYVLHLVVLASIYSILAVSLNLAVGYTGLLTLAHGAFYAAGAYTVALLTTDSDVHFLLALLAGMAIGGIAAALVSPILRLKGHFFILATVAVQLTVTQVLYNWVSVTKGPFGITGVPHPVIAGFQLNSPGAFLLLSLPLAALVALLTRQLVESPFGRVLKAIRANPPVAESIGKNVFWFQFRVFVVTGVMASLAGGLYAAYARFVDPSPFTIDLSTVVLTMVVLGGTGQWWGSVIGAAMLLIFSEAVRFVPEVPSTLIGPVQSMLFAAVLLLVILLRPRGLVGTYRLE